MITFASLFLGLVLGSHSVEVLVDDSVAVVEIHLDGAPIALIEGAPWRIVADLGTELAPHRLEAIAFDAEGRELDRTQLWINMARAPAEARLLLEGGDDGRSVRARLVWESIISDSPLGVSIEFDGRPLAVESFESFELPDHDPDQLHFLRVELEFSELVSSVVELTFGGTYTDQIVTEQTAIPMLIEDKKPPSIGSLQGYFSKNGAPLRVLAIEEGPAEIIIVRDGEAQEGLDDLIREQRIRVIRAVRGNTLAAVLQNTMRHVAKLGRDHRVRFVSPYPVRHRRASFSFELFPPTPEYTREDGGLAWLLTSLRPRRSTTQVQRLIDAVAVAGILASARDRRRAVVLILSGNPADASQLDFARVRSFLGKLRVPLYVWSTEKAATDSLGQWGESADISNVNRLVREVRILLRQLDRQRIVWLEGYHLPQAVTLSARSGATDLTM